MPILPGVLVREARSRAGLSQRALASLAETAQSVVGRIERGQTSPTWETFTRLLAAAGFTVDVHLAVRPVVASHMLADVERILALAPEERLNEIAKFSRFVWAAERV